MIYLASDNFAATHPGSPSFRKRLSVILRNREKSEIRMIASWDTSDQDVEAVSSVFKKLSKE